MFRGEDEIVTGTDKDGNLDRQLYQYRNESERSNYFHIFMQITLLKHANAHAKTHKCTFSDSQTFMELFYMPVHWPLRDYSKQTPSG